jgi:uncharacterized membrane protein
MHKGRLEAFSDGVLAIIITIMVLELRAPQHAAQLSDLRPLLPVFLSYVISFVYVGIYWNNHHHMFQVTQHVTGAVLWANLHLLFWLSLVPFATGWLGENNFAKAPAAFYGFVLLMCGAAYSILQFTILHEPGGNPLLAKAIGRDLKGRISVMLYAVAILVSRASAKLAMAIYVLVAMIWLLPDPRIEKAVRNPPQDQ